MTIVTVSGKGQLVLPAEVRRRFGLTAGSRLECGYRYCMLCRRRAWNPAMA